MKITIPCKPTPYDSYARNITVEREDATLVLSQTDGDEVIAIQRTDVPLLIDALKSMAELP